MTIEPQATYADLDRDDMIWHDGLIREVRHVEPYTDVEGLPLVLVVLAGAEAITAEAITRAGGESVWRATAEDIAGAAATRKRDGMAAGLRALADLIQDAQLPVPNYSIDVRGLLADEAEVRAWAARAGVPVREPREQDGHVAAEWAWPSRDVPSFERCVELYFHARRDEETSAGVTSPSADGAQEGTPAQSVLPVVEAAGGTDTNTAAGDDLPQADGAESDSGAALVSSPAMPGVSPADGESAPAPAAPSSCLGAAGVTPTDSPAGRDPIPAVATTGLSGRKPGEVETGQGTTSRDPSARDSASPARRRAIVSGAVYDRWPTIVLAEGETYEQWYGRYALTLDGFAAGWHRDDLSRMASGLADEALKRRQAEAGTADADGGA